VAGDAVIEYDPVPAVRTTRAEVVSIRVLAEDLLEVRLRPNKMLTWVPGQYVRVTFRGYPARDYSPTLPFDLDLEEGLLVFHVRRYPGGQVSSALGTGIRPGHRVTLRGPFGNAFLRRQSENLVLVSTGTGFAPIWAMAVSCVLGQRGRPICVIAGTRTKSQLYMGDAIAWLREHRVPTVLTAGDGDGRAVRNRRPAEFLSFVTPRDVVYAAGSPSQVAAARIMSLARGAEFHADPFYAAETKRPVAARIIDPIRRVIGRRTQVAASGAPAY
jgi:ferredoxin-NAD(P)+ reductase (naphthalene dioxygenase ferredoxin-specific)